uniref:Uncharacterized protein n=1 Tax=Arundo donax TaxID=35708 RepID=A0A0A8ZH79_ARUDO
MKSGISVSHFFVKGL